MEGTFFDWWSQLFRIQQQKLKHLRLLPLSFVERSLYMFLSSSSLAESSCLCT